MCRESGIAEKIEILGLDLFDSHREEIKIIERFSDSFDAALGWHYYLDLAWILREVSVLPKGSLLLDAGAGSGILQFILAELGYNVISVDFMGRDFSKGYARKFNKVIHSLNSQKNSIRNSYTRHLKAVAGCEQGLLHKISEYFSGGEKSISPVSYINDNRFRPGPADLDNRQKCKQQDNSGHIFLYKCDIGAMQLLPDGIVDGVVSVSALEHNSHAGFEKCMSELLRVTKPSGILLVTVSAAQGEDCFHEPSKGWCYSEQTLRELFRLSENARSNYCRNDELFQALKSEGNELQKRLCRVYFESGDNGMPWGIWEPQYQPVGVVKIK